VDNCVFSLIERTGAQAPGVRLRFVAKPDKDGAPLRTGAVDLETGVVDGDTRPELRTQALFRDRFIGVVRSDHALSRAKITPASYAAGRHVVFSRRGVAKGRIDESLAALGLAREVVTIVGGFATAIALARATDLIATVPDHHTRSLRDGLFSFALPFAAPEITVSLLWHPRLDADPAHRWLRDSVREVVAGGEETAARNGRAGQRREPRKRRSG
jgi:DNA-binding transcriptional LysR family regulator